MRNAIIAAAALSFITFQTAANADGVARYQGAASIQHMSAPQRTQAFAQAEGGGGRGETMYGRRYAQAEAPTVNQQRHAQAEAPTVNQQRYAAGEQTGVDNGSFHTAAAEQSGVDNGRPA